MTNPFGLFEPDQRFRAALTTIDLGRADVIVTRHGHAADWARNHGYTVVIGTHEDGPVYEIHPAGEWPRRPTC